MTKRTKQQYRIRNWQQYNRALVGRGSLTLWLDTSSTDAWLDASCPGRRGRRRTYTDAAILSALLLREVYHLPRRSTEGFLSSVLRLMQVKLPSPHYSTLSRRARHLQLSLAAPRKISHLIIDSTGLKLYGEGEWKVRLHGMDKRRSWRKLHLAMDASTHQLTASIITEKERFDRTVLPLLLDETEAKIEAVCADGAYDFAVCYQAIKERAAKPLIPPRSDAVVRSKTPFEQRDEHVRKIKKLGRRRWQKESNYHRCSLIECAFFRLKTVFTEKLKSRTIERQQVEARVRCLALNRMTRLGMPQSYSI